jgi:hypothetical protein
MLENNTKTRILETLGYNDCIGVKDKDFINKNPLTQKHQHNTTNNPTLCNEQQQKKSRRTKYALREYSC